jgi:regulator of extracellular matrix RemA (YlzA/DUF370 family)
VAEARLINVGFGNLVVARRVIGVIDPKSAPMKRLREDAKNEHRLVDATQGHKTRSIIVMDSNHLILSSVQPATIRQRFLQEGGSE